jgi:diaminopimelate decarboxylase
MTSPTLWMQARSSISNLTKRYSDSIFVAGCFGNQKGNDLDVFLVFKVEGRSSIHEYLKDFRKEIILNFKKTKKNLIPFRFAITKAFIPYLIENTITDDQSLGYLPVHLLLFPDVHKLLEWEDHEIIRQIFSDIINDGDIWVGKKQDFIHIDGYLKERDYYKRKAKYEELLFGAFQDSCLDALEGAKERALEQSGYASRYLALDDAKKKYGENLSRKADILEYMNDKDIPGGQLLSNNILPNFISECIYSSFNFWSPKPSIIKPPNFKRLKQLRSFCNYLHTPSFIIEEEKIEENLISIKDAFSVFDCPIEICYAIKANPIVPVVQLISDFNYGGLCATSYSDISVLRQINIEPEIVNVHLHFPEDELLIESVNKKYRIIISDEYTLLRIIELSRQGQISTECLNVFIRLKPEVANRSGYYRFGIDFSKVKSIIELLRENDIKVSGFAMHANAASTDPISWAQSLIPIRKAINDIWIDLFSDSPIIIIGGGISSTDSLAKAGQTITNFSTEVKNIFDGIDLGSIIIETGRFIIGDSGFVITKIKGLISSEKDKSIKTLVIDAGSNFLVPLDSADFTFYNAEDDKKDQDELLYNIADSWSSFGIIGRTVKLKGVKKVGDNLILGNAGAYTYSMASNSGDGIPPFKILRKMKTKHAFSSSFHFVQNEDYLESKFELDKPLIEKVMPRVRDLLNNTKNLKVLDVGCGTGAYLYHMVHCNFHQQFKHIEYSGFDISGRMIQSAKNKWKSHQNKMKTINANFTKGSLFDLNSLIETKEFDLVVGLSLLEYAPEDTAIQQLIQMTRYGGLIHLPINYDAETQFEPTFDRNFEEKMVKYFNSNLIPDPWSGRKLYNKLISSNLKIIDFRVDDWIILPSSYTDSGLGYTMREEIFLTQLLKAIQKIEPDNYISETEKNNWLLLRNSQIEKRELSFICRQCSALAQR